MDGPIFGGIGSEFLQDGFEYAGPGGRDAPGRKQFKSHGDDLRLRGEKGNKIQEGLNRRTRSRRFWELRRLKKIEDEDDDER
jgi:hypothetical protein